MTGYLFASSAKAKGTQRTNKVSSIFSVFPASDKEITDKEEKPTT